MSETLKALLSDMAGPDVSVALSDVTDDHGLLEAETYAVAKAIPKRRAEFAAGRRAARDALEHLGEAPVAIPQGDKRAPIWPDGISGSISHDNGIAAAAVAYTTKVARIGLDLTEAADFPEHLRSQILMTERESAQSALDARINFSAKETVFKAFYGDAHHYFGFDAVEILPDLASGQFAVNFRRDLGPMIDGETLTGRVGIDGDHLVTCLVHRV